MHNKAEGGQNHNPHLFFIWFGNRTKQAEKHAKIRLCERVVGLRRGKPNKDTKRQT